VVLSVSTAVLATDINGRVIVQLQQDGNGFSRALLQDIVVNQPPPKATAQASTRILRRRDGTFFIGKPHNSNAKKASAYLKEILKPYSPIVPYNFPISIEVQYQFPFNKTEKKANIKKGIIPHHKRPDSDNLMKGLFDICSKLNWWNDDSQLCEVKFGKFYSNNPSIKIKIYELLS
jgi:Holliday junction resolvase RusA-like endonuclease